MASKLEKNLAAFFEDLREMLDDGNTFVDREQFLDTACEHDLIQHYDEEDGTYVVNPELQALTGEAT